MEKSKKIVKDDINFLEYPIWITDRKNKTTVWEVVKSNGTYKITSPDGLPKHLDKTVLYSLLYKLFKETELNSYVITTNRHDIAKNVFSLKKDFGKNRYNRIINALQKWTALNIRFDGLFYLDGKHVTKSFHIIDEFTLTHESGELSIKFNESYIRQLKESKFYKLIDFEQYKTFTKSSSARLFEVLVKTFKECNQWAINIQSLGEKLTFEKRKNTKTYYPSDVLRYLKPAVSEINKKSDMQIDFKYNNETGICIFKKVKKMKEVFISAAKEDEKKKEKDMQKQVNACIKQFKLLPQEQQEEILNAIKRDQFLRFVPDENSRIFSYMVRNELYVPKN